MTRVECGKVSYRFSKCAHSRMIMFAELFDLEGSEGGSFNFKSIPESITFVVTVTVILLPPPPTRV